jgi:multidrug resistance protein, MATE family
MPIIALSEIKAVAKLALPLMAAFLAQKGMQLIDTVMMGWIGPDALAAGALALVTFMTLIVFCMGTLSAVGVFCAHARGANTLLGVTTALQNGLCLALLLALPLMLLVWHIPALLLATGQVPGVVHNSQLLLHSLVWGVPGLLLFLVGRICVSI